MLPSRFEILAEATSTLINKFSIVFFLNLYYTFITYNGRKSNEQQAKITDLQGTMNEEKVQPLLSCHSEILNVVLKKYQNKKKYQLSSLFDLRASGELPLF